jgi:hypothetical protein
MWKVPAVPMDFVKPLLAIVACHRFQRRIESVRSTWLTGSLPIDYKIFYGRGSDRTPAADEVFLDVDDGYHTLPHKVQAIMKWAMENGYDAVCKVDDDVYVFPDRLMNALPHSPYEGRVNYHSKMAPLGWCSGFSYWVAGEGLQKLVDAGEPKFKAEDVWVGTVMSKNNIKAVAQHGFRVMSVVAKDQWPKHRFQIVTACEFIEAAMLDFDKAMKEPGWQAYPLRKDPTTGKAVARFGEVLRRGMPHRRRGR